MDAERVARLIGRRLTVDGDLVVARVLFGSRSGESEVDEVSAREILLLLSRHAPAEDSRNGCGAPIISGGMKALGAAVVTLLLVIGVAAQSGTGRFPQAPLWPSRTAGITSGRTGSPAAARRRPCHSAEALRKSNGPCPICDPWSTSRSRRRSSPLTARRKEECAFAAGPRPQEAKHEADEAEAEQLKRLADMEAARKAREMAPVRG